MSLRVVCALSMMMGLGCSGDDAAPQTYQRPSMRDASTNGGCVDEDDDGYCLPNDCDDNDPDVAALCCVDGADPTEGCPCEEGTESEWCDPNEVADMETVQDGVHGVLKCSEGARFCRDAQWTACEGVGWIFQPG